MTDTEKTPLVRDQPPPGLPPPPYNPEATAAPPPYPPSSEQVHKMATYITQLNVQFRLPRSLWSLSLPQYWRQPVMASTQSRSCAPIAETRSPPRWNMRLVH